MPSFDVPSFDVPSFDVPSFDVPSFDVPSFDVPISFNAVAARGERGSVSFIDTRETG